MVKLDIQSGPRVAPTTGDLTTTYEGSDRMSDRTCSYPGCPNGKKTKGWCHGHYKQSRSGREMTPLLVKMGPEERFWSKVKKGPGCWMWSAYINADGYGSFFLGEKNKKAHRVAYEFQVGPIPDGMELDHLCWNRACVNPAHLRCVTHSQNSQNYDAHNPRSATGVRGVRWRENSNKYEAYFRQGGRNYYLGLHETLGGAAEAVSSARRQHMPYSIMDQHLGGGVRYEES